jgi:hypothetical protein
LQISAWIKKIARSALALALLASTSAATAPGNRDGMAEFRRCAGVKADGERLACFDAAARKASTPRFEGRLGLSTELFEVSQPTRLRYQSDGVIFVLYLKDAAGEVLQNLHIGGGGEDSYLIEKPGKYSLQINGSESWRVWLDPE